MSEEILITKDRERKKLKFSCIEDRNKMFTNFKKCMERHNHNGILWNNENEVPTAPTAALARLTGAGSATPPPTDARDKYDILKVMKTWNNSCIIILGSLLAMLS